MGLETDLQIKNIDVPKDLHLNDNMVTWFEFLATTYELDWLLVHCDDGIIWGKFNDATLQVPDHDIVPKLRYVTVQTAYLFSTKCEVFIWNDQDHGIQARSLIDDTNTEHFDEDYLIWGDTSTDIGNGFTKLEHGSEGLVHVIPLVGSDIMYPRLKVRHFIDYDTDNQAYIKMSRLVTLLNKGENK
ncbi:type III-D CRISPR-associated protein Csx19 [Methanosalsum natronophilum]|uniref:type III-D CRISPR-associated protein Csx19 n=1 Tax=Methanosalsum natronophilum TaxID=768733 RepID=UPI0021684781|nr:CRISPR-associated protein Csx19 [Methanosalsum natronophilum]MCS3924841.1 CRISPR-associated protein (TIGR03984 family) [Methanosalsum natronophilum]